MSGPSTYVPKSKIGRWFESRLAHDGAGPFVVRRLSDAAQPQLHVGVRGDPVVHAGRADRHRRRARDALCRIAERGLHLGHRHDHARTSTTAGCSATCTRTARRCSSSRSTSTCSAASITGPSSRRGKLLWILGVDHLLPDDRHRLPRLRAAMGRDELRRRDRHHQPRLRHPARRHEPRPLAVGRFRGRRARR